MATSIPDPCLRCFFCASFGHHCILFSRYFTTYRCTRFSPPWPSSRSPTRSSGLVRPEKPPEPLSSWPLATIRDPRPHDPRPERLNAPPSSRLRRDIQSAPDIGVFQYLLHGWQPHTSYLTPGLPPAHNPSDMSIKSVPSPAYSLPASLCFLLLSPSPSALPLPSSRA